MNPKHNSNKPNQNFDVVELKIELNAVHCGYSAFRLTLSSLINIQELHNNSSKATTAVSSWFNCITFVHKEVLDINSKGHMFKSDEEKHLVLIFRIMM